MYYQPQKYIPNTSVNELRILSVMIMDSGRVSLDLRISRGSKGFVVFGSLKVKIVSSFSCHCPYTGKYILS